MSTRNTRHQWFSRRHFASQRRGPRRPGGTLPFQRRLRIEPLEDRRLLALVTVTTLGDTVDFNDGVTSLREAIFTTNLVGGADTIDFAASLTSGGPATLTLTQGELAISDALAINGPGANLLTIDASGNDPTPDVNNGDGSRVFNIDDGNSGNLLDVSISGLTLTGGDKSGSGGTVFDLASAGGAIRSFEDLTVTDSSISGNSATRGGGIWNRYGSLTVTGSTISGNSASGNSGNYSGGGIYSRDGNLALIGTTISGNSATGSGGGIESYRGSLTVTGSTISGNSANLGGGIRTAYGSLLVTASTISGNSGYLEGGAIDSTRSNLTVTHSTLTGNSAGSGGGIFNFVGSLTVTGSTISGNSADRGGGIWNRYGSLTVTDSTMSGNSADYSGGGIYSGGNLALIGTTISGNSAGVNGGGISSVRGGNLTVIDSTISGNSADRQGGGIYSYFGNVTVTESTISGNSASGNGGGISKRAASLAVTLSTISGNSASGQGGGIYGHSSTTLTVTSSTISGNSAALGAGIFNRSTLRLTDSAINGNAATGSGGGLFSRGFGNVTVANSTISGNSAGGSAGGVYLLGTGLAAFTIRHSTITANTAGGVGGGINIFGGTLSLDQTILAANTALVGPDLADLAGLPVAVRYSLIGDNANSGLAEAPIGAPDANGNLIGGPVHGVINPQLGLLGSNGGTTITHALLAGSPAIDAGDATAVAGVGTVPVNDQRGEPFARVFGGRIDIGAYERQTVPGLSLVVDTLVDESDGNYSLGDLSLREAIGLANGSVGADTITFDASLTSGGPAIILLTQGEMRIFDALVIDGPGAELLAIDASGNDPTPDVNNGDGSRVFNIDDGNTGNLLHVSISGLTLTGGDVTGSGGAMFARENLTVTDSTISGNSAGNGGGISASGSVTVTSSTISDNSTSRSSFFHGGGISASGSVTVTDSTISGNSAGGRGGGISASGSVTVANSTISGNSADHRQGGGISASGSLTVTNSTISGNSAGYNGGGIFGSNVTVTNSTISGNSTGGYGGGGIRAYSVTVTNSTISGNSGGVFVRGGGISAVSVMVTSSTISGNSAGGSGGGISSFAFVGSAAVTVADSTISGNSAGVNGGGIYSHSSTTLTVTSSTISGNSATVGGGGLFNVEGTTIIRFSTITGNAAPAGMGSGVASNGETNPSIITRTDVYSSIIAGNMNSDVDLTNGTSNSFLSLGHNLIGSGNATGEFIEPGDQTGVTDPLLAPLADNGGPTLTHALLPGSPAIDAGDPSAAGGLGDAPLYDQRGAPFPRVAGGRIDMGAFEVQLRGDMDFDGDVDFDDIGGFVLGLNDAVAYEAFYGAPPSSNGDTDGDGDQDFDDIDDFVALLIPPAPLLAQSSVETHAHERNQLKDDHIAAIWSDDVDWLGHAKARKRGRIALEFWDGHGASRHSIPPHFAADSRVVATDVA